MWRDKDAGHTRIAALEPDLSTGETAYDLVKKVIGEQTEDVVSSAA